MTWHAAHIIQYFKKKEGVQKVFLVYENVVLIEAETEDEAWKEAERIGKEEYGYDDVSLKLDDEPALMIFGGVRKLLKCEDLPNIERSRKRWRPGHGTEVTYSEYEVDIEELQKLVDEDKVMIISNYD